jgi:hypothetical protein
LSILFLKSLFFNSQLPGRLGGTNSKIKNKTLGRGERENLPRARNYLNFNINSMSILKKFQSGSGCSPRTPTQEIPIHIRNINPKQAKASSIVF